MLLHLAYDSYVCCVFQNIYKKIPHSILVPSRLLLPLWAPFLIHLGVRGTLYPPNGYLICMIPENIVTEHCRVWQGLNFTVKSEAVKSV